MIKERYCSYEVARLLKEKGFRECCRYCYGTAVRHNGEDIDEDEEFELKSEGRADEIEYIKGGILHNLYYDNGKSFGKDVCATPTHQMACDWLMTKDIYICPKYCCFQRCKKNDKPCCKWEPTILSLLSSAPLYPQLLDVCEYYKTYGEAVDAAIKYSLENLV